MDKPSPNNPHLHDWLTAPSFAQKPFDPTAFDPKQMLETMAASFGPMKALSMQQMELVTLASRRAQAYLGITQRLARCRTHADLVNEQMRFWQTALSQYQDATTRIAHAWGDVFAALPKTAVSPAVASGVTFPKPAAPVTATAKPAANRTAELIRVPAGGRRKG